MFLPSFLKDNLYPSFEQCKKAEQRAEEKDPKSRDTRELMSILMRLVDANPRLRGHILTRRTALSSFSWSIVPYEKTDEERAILASTRLRKTISRVIQYHTDSPCFGVGVMELTWETTIAGMMPMKIKRLLPVEISHSLHGDGVQKISTDGEKTYTPLIGQQKWLIDVYSDSTIGGALRTIMRQQILLDMQYKQFAEFNKRLKGILLGQWKEGTDETNKGIATEAIKSIGKNDYAATDETITMQLVEAVSSGGYEAYNTLIEKINANTAIAILGQANTSELSGTGSRAALQVLKMISADIMYEDMIRVENLINEQLCLYDFQLNYDQNAIEAPYRFQFNWHEDKDTLKEAQVIREALAAGVPLPEAEVYARIGYTMPEAGTKVIAPTVPSIAL